MMVCRSRFALLSIGLALVSFVASAQGQLVINELVQDNRTNGNSNSDDLGEFIEIYNSSGMDVDLTGWILNVMSLDDNLGIPRISFPLFGTIPANDPYYVIANASSGNLSSDLIDWDTMTNNFLANENSVYELRNPQNELVDALGVQLTFTPQYDFATPEQLAEMGGGGWAQLVTTVETPQSYARYRDGEDSNKNGRDFGVIPSTPGGTNNLPEVGVYVVPNVDALGQGTAVPGFSYSFVAPRAVDPTIVGGPIKHAAAPSPQGGKAIVAWDETGGGNMVASNSLVTSFDIFAYIDTINTGQTGTAKQIEATTYGIGTTDAFFGTPDPTGELTTVAETANGNTGVGWLFVKEDTLNFKKLFLVDFNDGGDSKPAGNDWTVLETIDLAGKPSAWARLAVDYDPETGEVVARYNDQVFNHTITTDMVGTFYVGYREPAAAGVSNNAAPPIFQQYLGSTAIPGDLDGDGDVDGRDFLHWQRGGTTPAYSPAKLLEWQNAYNNGMLSGIGAVPEPSALGLLLVACAGLLPGRGQRK